MKSIKFIFFICYLLFNSNICNLSATEKATNEIIVCGDDQVLIFDADRSDENELKIIWKWKVADVKSQLPSDYQKLLIPLDECKPVDNNSKLLLTSSGGGVLLLERRTGKCLFYACAPMAHSAEILPNNRIVVALSTHDKGNRIELYDIATPEKVIYQDSLYSGHGSVWMEEESLLYVLGYDELRAYSLKKWESDTPELLLEKKWIIPVESGHDLVRVSNNELLISGHEGVYWFNTENELFEPFEPLFNEKNVKSLNYNKTTGRLIYTKAEIDWWTHNIYCQNPFKTYVINDVDLYKVRVVNN